MVTILLQVSSTLYLNKAFFDISSSMQEGLSISCMIKFVQEPLDLYRHRCREEHGLGL
jgi:hypothetical protein